MLIRSKGEVLGTVEAADTQAAEKVAAIQFELDEFQRGDCWCGSWHGERKPRTVQLAAYLVHEILGEGQQGQCICFRDRVWVGKRLHPIAQSDYEASARRLFNQVSYVCPAETLLRLRRGSDVLVKMPADGLGNVRE